MARLGVAMLVTVAAVLSAPTAAADPRDRIPYCSGDQTPMDNNCRPMAYQVIGDIGLTPGGDPTGLTPGEAPILGGN